MAAEHGGSRETGGPEPGVAYPSLPRQLPTQPQPRVEQISAALEALQRDAMFETAQLRSDLAQVAQGHDELGEDLRQRTDAVVEHLVPWPQTFARLK